ncbi:3'(2'),5'-bisphosphate nucleotidase CysQ [Salegentibacter salegens]|uniref:3'(2'),5'-bisphosphate nucleotidase CysQ n=1 Tax=Salegentibacter salegens TaxID=143223 RepID=A0A1M7HBJ4_9FLAO|nr:3'(2'),5'-bisphosphate nucleotidase CysQ [Salegentibacter salegens]PRX43526.1 3'(2'),5'-bisphosphate nucleotidase [Salegentibacter salegens]SHM25703.1 3'(2'),5'-bisphosphate nucleotidase [Salegentibacter salegens]
MKSEIQNEIIEDFLVAIQASVKAGIEIMNIYKNDDFQVELKEDDSPVTIADKSANAIINDFLKSTGIPIISEENEEIAFSERDKWNKCWIVDPLDGTKEFIKKSGEFTVNIALIENNKPVFGVIYIPVSKELYYGDVKAKRSFKVVIDDEKKVEDLSKNAQEIFPGFVQKTINVAGSRSHINKETLGFIEAIKEKYDQDVKVIPKGSSLKFCLIAEGLIDVYPRLGPTMEWDTAAGHAICKAVGLKVIDKETEMEMVYNRKNLLNNSFIVSNLQ